MITIFVLLLFVSKVFSQECFLDVSDPESPFIVTEDLTFPAYDVDRNQTFTFTKGDFFYLECPAGTQSPHLNENGDRAMCRGGTEIFNIKTIKTLDFGDIKCKSKAATTVENKNERCATSGTIFEIGFNISSDFLTSITICFDKKKLTPIYCTFNNFFNASLPEFLPLNNDNYYQSFVCNGTDCHWSDSGSVYDSIDIDKIYDNQEEIVQNLTSSNANFTLLRFPLTIMNLWYLNVRNNGQEIQKLPYYDYINIVPVWNFELLDVFFYVLDTTVSRKANSSMHVGTLGVATLPDNEDKPVELYLADDKVPVPKWIWVVMDKNEEVFFFYNSLNSDESINEVGKICVEHKHVTPGMFTCSYDSVTDEEMRQIIDNDLSM